MRSVAGLAFLTFVGLLVGAVALGQSRSAQGTDFNFQGRLTVDGSSANGAFDLQFELFADPSGGSPLGSVVLLDDVTVTDGLFTAVLDFGSQFEGSARYVQTSVRAGADTGAYTPISPRQALRGSPYALYALAIPLAGSGTASTAAHSDHEHDAVYWKRKGNGGTAAGTDFLGTTDAQALELKVNGVRALRLEPDPFSPNLIGGFSQNSVSSGIRGGTVGGGGTSSSINRVTNDYGTVGGGKGNTASGAEATVGGGDSNTASGSEATVGGGADNIASEQEATVGGGGGNTASSAEATVGGGGGNTASGLLATVGGGARNTALGMLATVGGGGSVTAGQGNRATDDHGTVGGGLNNQAGDNAGTTADRPYATVGGGNGNSAINSGATVAGGGKNVAGAKIISVAGRAIESGQYASVGGGFTNTAHGSFATIGGGQLNSAEDNATVGGGNGNTASGSSATVPGGDSNIAAGNYSLASGRRAKANHAGSFVWADSTDADFASTSADQVSIRAAGGVRLASNAGAARAIGVGDLFRDNVTVAWAKVTATGTLSAEFGVTAVSHTGTGNYAITINASAASDFSLVPVANAEIDGPPGTTDAIRIVSIDQTGVNTFSVYINKGTGALVDNDFVFQVTAR